MLFDNLAKTTGGVWAASPSQWQGQQFATDGDAYELAGITLWVSRSASPGDARLSLFTSAGTPATPGTLLASMTLSTITSGSLQAATFTPTGTVSLGAGTTYWAVLDSLTPGTTFSWAWTSDNTGAGAGFSSAWAESTNAGVSWTPYPTSPHQMSVDAIRVVPEPATWVLASVGIGVCGVLHRLRIRRRRTPCTGFAFAPGFRVQSADLPRPIGRRDSRSPASRERGGRDSAP